MRFYDPQKGKITIDGVDIEEMNRDALRKMYGMVLQDSWLFKGTIKENIAYGKPEATDEEIIEAAKKARVHKYIMSLPQGYDTVVEEDGGNMSQGQMQLVCIARIMLTHPPMLILDEATSMLDPRGKIEINNLVHELNKTQNMTILSITHDIEEAALSDHVVLLDNGHIIDEGTPEKVLTQKEELERIGLDVPFAYKISKKLYDSGYPIKPIINKEKLVKELCQLNLKK